MRRMNGTTLRFEGAGGGRRARASRLVLVALSFGLSLGGSSCSLIVDREADQCETTADCAAFPGTTCNDGVCTGATIGECQTNQQCVDKMGPFHICRRSDKSCVPLLSPLCTTVEGDYLDDNAFYFGSVTPLTGDEPTGLSNESAIKLALRDFKQAATGLPARPGTDGRLRPMVLISCNDNTESVTGVEAATHLVETVQVPAIIGAAYSGITIALATEVTIPNNVLLISPSATSVNITTLDDNDLVWRTAPSDIFQSSALALYLPQVEADVRAELMLMAADKIKVAFIHKGDAYGSGLATALEEKALFNGALPTDAANTSFYERFNYGDPDNQMQFPTKYAEAAEAVIMQEPHLVVLLGTAEVITEVLVRIETGWTNAAYRPRYLLSDGPVLTTLWETIGADDDLRQRVTGSVPGTVNPIFTNFRSEFDSNFTDEVSSPEIFGAAGSYDATYLLAFSSAASATDTGPNLAEGLKRLIGPGDVFRARRDDISPAFQALASGNSIDFEGASGPLAFDLETGEAPSDIQIWCMPKDNSGNAASTISSGLFYNAATLELQGAFNGAMQCEFDP